LSHIKNRREVRNYNNTMGYVLRFPALTIGLNS
jgi:hypothetical protein